MSGPGRFNWLKVAGFALVILILAQINNWRVLDRLFLALVAFLFVAFVWSWSSLRGLMIERESGVDRAQVGQELVERLRIENRTRWGKLWIEARDHSTAPGHDASQVVSLLPGGRARWHARSICTRRGRFILGPLSLHGGDPFGLFPRQKLLPGGHEVLVYPATVDVSSFVLPVGELPGGANTQGRTLQVTPNAAGVREYLAGDSFNRISWNATARTGKLMVKEFELDPTADVWVILDMDARPHVAGLVADTEYDDPLARMLLNSSEEYAVTAAASLARHFLNQNRTVGLMATGQHREVIPTDRGARQLLKILEALAVLRAEGRQSLPELLVAESARFGRHSTLLVITPSTDEALVGILAGLVGRGVKVVAVLVEPSTFGAAESSIMTVGGLAAIGVPTYLLKRGEDVSRSLAPGGAGLGRGGRA
ncbi:MAG: FIG002343: hypothetical protein [uncultured Thermomicrobiales bacterium]|uniref:DUF58 domain-containing protein n=1 Tax=uncultured Thermomicrobiales bacterium TaxID=1645740 RepID=A0A6J4VN86_9BACT|nr:MAG: FIG002343: hypothetical protein [uncultured Thermomicrobiales bacterium]